MAEFGTPKTLADLKHHHGLFYRGKLGVLRFKDLKANQFIEIKEKMMSNNAGSLIEMAICGAGIVMMPDWVVADEIRTGKLVAILTDTPVSSDNTDICVAILTPQSAYRPVNVQAVIDFFVEKWDEGRNWAFQAG